MGETDVTLKVSVEGAEEAAEKIQELVDQTKATGEASKEAAQGLGELGTASDRAADSAQATGEAAEDAAKGVSSLEQEVGRAETRLNLLASELTRSITGSGDFSRAVREAADTITTSNHTIQEQKLLLESVSEVVTRVEGDIRKFTDSESAIDEVTEASRLLDDRLKSLSESSATVAEGSRRLGDSMADAGKSADELRQSTGEMTEFLRSGFDRARAALDKYNAKLADGTATGIRAITPVVLAQKSLREEIERTEAATGHYATEARRQYEALDREVQQAIQTHREVRDEVSDLNRVTQKAGEHWTGLGNALENVAGNFGTVAAKAGLASAALSEGIRLGNQFNQFIGSDTTEMEAVITRIGQKLRVMVENLADFGAGIVNLATADSIGEIRNAVGELFDSVKTGAEENLKVLTLYGDEWDAYAETIGVVKKTQDEVTDAVKETTAATADGIAATAAAEEAERTRAAAIAEIAQQLASQSEAQDRVNQSLADAQTDLTSASADLSAYSEVVSAAAHAVSSLEAAHRGAAEKTAELARTRQDGDLILKQATERERLLAEQLADSRQRLEEARQKQSEAATAYKHTSDQVARLTENVGDSDEKLLELVRENAALVAQTKSPDYWATKAAESSGELREAYQQLLNLSTRLPETMRELATPTGQVAEETTKAAEGMEKLSGLLQSSPEAARQFLSVADAIIAKIGELAEAVNGLETAVDSVSTKAIAAEAALDRMSRAGLDESASVS